ncbi:type II toxin-antitoxin system Phd/YefM family antitoxin [Iningainema tapete]|uniref:Type II toxin-antitoxin system Phd/YefM family antitoxin n=1 Tax=Iningainema tapete BLCC-T55 TaxID=2748662 RepID=A0A8J6XZ10_9CYAN|nr:type II toxin-antitoxin system Phd/YefM family antitoxin [Iningainema tapete]MBD2775738.1 type II toxin-antitoxin system Phd/YefM family antitoxin [Iningainema tapete BLCC-T55]
MISLDNIHSFTDFQRNARKYAENIRETKQPVVLTINGEAALVVHEAHTFQEILERLQKAEEELQRIKFDTLRQDIESGLRQIEQGQGISGKEFFEKMRQRSQALQNPES